jgi:phosphoribosylformylglycinamidine cyclo-ligase
MQKQKTPTNSAYKDAGVDIDAAAALVERIKPHVKSTARAGVMSGIGGFGALFDLKETRYKDPVLVSATDGVGTKLKIATEMDRHDTIGIDAVAMCVNDIIVQGAEPLFFLDYFATGKLQTGVAEDVIKGIAEGCRQAGCALIGGETAEMPGMYAPGEYDIAGFTVGAVERNEIITGARIKSGDIILGLSSNGLHSNGFSLVRKIIKTTQGYTYESRVPFEKELNLGELALIPTRIYVKSILKALEHKNADGKPLIKGMAHITGGGLIENIPRILPEETKAEIKAQSWRVPSIFKWLLEVGGLDKFDMARTLNCGIGLVVVVDEQDAKTISNTLKKQGESVFEIGQIVRRDNAHDQVVLQKLEEAWC